MKNKKNKTVKGFGIRSTISRKSVRAITIDDQIFELNVKSIKATKTKILPKRNVRAIVNFEITPVITEYNNIAKLLKKNDLTSFNVEIPVNIGDTGPRYPINVRGIHNNPLAVRECNRIELLLRKGILKELNDLTSLEDTGPRIELNE